MSKTIKILLTDDHEIVRNGLKLMLSQQKTFTPQITEAENGYEVIEKVKKEHFDIIMLDINMPEMDGLATTKHLMQHNPNLNIMILTMYNEDYIIKQLLQAGAKGYILKNTGLEELTKAIVTVASSSKYYSNEVSQALLNGNTGGSQLNKPGRIDLTSNLSNREKEVLMLISKELTNVQIAEKLFISKRTVDGHRSNLLSKLGLKNTAGLIKFAVENGFV